MSTNEFPIKIKGEHSPNASFREWLRANTALFVSQLAAISSLIIYIATFTYYVIGHDPGSHKIGIEEYLDRAKFVIFILNIIFCIVFTSVSVYIINSNHDGKDHVRLFNRRVFNIELDLDGEIISESCRKQVLFKKAFLCYWILALSYYILSLFIDKIHNAFFHAYWQFVITCFVSGVIYWMINIFLTSKRISNKTGNEHGNAEKKSEKEYTTSKLLISPIGILIYLLLILSFPFIYKQENDFMISFLIIGIANMVLLSILITRIDSKLIGLPSWLVSVLYLYAAIQPLDFALNQGSMLERMIFISDLAIAFVLKIYFFLILVYITQTGRLMNYFSCNGLYGKRINETRGI